MNKSDRSDNPGLSLIQFYRDIWNKRERVSAVSGKRLLYFDVCCFAHVLAKGKYPKFKFYEKNICLLTPYEHFLVDSSTKELRDKYAKENPSCAWERFYDLRDELLKEY